MRRLAGAGGAAAASGETGGRAPAFARRRPGLFRAAACLVVAAATLLALPAGVSAQAQNEVRSTWALTPSGLSDGDKFRLIFITSTGRTGNATSSDIEVYNTFVQDQAAAGHMQIRPYSSQFRVVGSTAAIDARDNTGTTGTGVPIYWLNGRKVANNYADFYDGSWRDEEQPKSELGTNLSLGFLALFTGSADDGTESFNTGGGSVAFGRESVRTGRLNHATANPLSGGINFGSNSGRFYGLSPVFTVKAGPAITDVSVTSRPADGTDTFKAGERIEVTFTFEEAVEVQNAGSNGANVSIRISMGDTNTYVTWSTNFLRMDPPRKLVFGLTVTSSHEDVDGLCISASCGADTIRLSGAGAIVAAADGAAASRNYDAVQTSWKVDGDTEGLTGGVCDRQPAVRDAIVAKVSAASTCAGVTDAQVNAIGSLDLSGEGIGALRKSDFEGLTSLHTLDLSGNALDHLPGDLFEHLDSPMRTLKLNGNPLGALPAGVFDGLTGIRTLDLADTGLTELPAGLFADLDSLQELRLVENRLRAFPSAALADVAGTLQRLFMRDNDIASIAAGGLDGMTQLRRLELQGNALTSLPAGLFDDLTELRELKLNDNSIAALPDNLLRPLTKVEVVSLEGNPGFAGFAPVVEAIPAQSVERGARVDLEAVLGASPWGDNVTWSWTQTDSSGTTVTLDDADTTTPSFDAPSPDEETALAFEATARGRGTSGADASEGTRTARVTVSGRASIVDVSVTSRPLDGGTTFKLGDRIEITATFSEPVQVVGAQPKSLVEVNMTFGARQLFVDYHRQDHPNRLIFRRVVEGGDNSNGALWLGNGDLQNGPIRGTMRLDGNASVTARSDSTNVRRGFEARQTEWQVDGRTRTLTGGVCGDGYHPAVLRAIVRAVPLAADCSEITSADLAQIDSLDVSGEDVDSLHKRDFVGLTGLLTLDLSGNALDHLPSNLFDHVTTLTELKLNGNDIAALPANVFNRLTALIELELHVNDIAVLPGNVFNLLTSLQALDLRANELTTLPPGVFDRLTELRRLRFSNNNLGTLPDNVFEPLTKLVPWGLWLSTNPGLGTFAPAVTVAVPAQTATPGERVDLEATAGPNPWGANLQWSWSQTDASGVTATLVDGNTRSAHFVAPAPVLETELGFQATATGRGTAGVGSPSRGTADAAVTVEDTTPPVLVSAEVPVSGGSLALTFNEDLDITVTKLPPADAFTVKADGVEVAVQGVVSGIQFDQFHLDLPAAAIGARQFVTVSYAVPATGTVIEDTAGNDALRFTDRPVTNNSTVANTTPPVLVSAEVPVSGGSLALTFNEDLDITVTKLPPADAFTVKADGVEVAVQGVVSGIQFDQFHLDLPAAAIGQNQIVTVSYAVPTTGTVIADTDGNRALAFDDEPVINNSTVFVMDATGTPTISGVPQVGNALRADTSDIEDDDGLPAAFTYEWVRVAPGGSGTPVGTNSSSYTVSSADVGSTIRVDVSFIDGAGNPEGPLPSDAVPAVAAAGACPADSDWRATLTMGYSFGDAGSSRLHNFGFDPGGTFGALDPATIPYGTGFTVTQIARLLTTSLDGNTITLDSLSFIVSGGDLPDGTVLNLGATALTVGTDSHSSTAGLEQWNLRTLGLSPTWVGGQEMTVCANLAPVLKSAKANGTSLILTYTEDLDTGSTPAASAYSVTVNGGAGPAVTNVSVSGDKVTLTLAAAVTAANSVTLTYTPGSNPVQDGSGLDAPGFADRTVAVNNNAVGEPTIGGMPQVGGMLTAIVSAIRDTDGLPSGFDYRWVRVATDSTETEIGTNSSRYSPTYADVGSTIRVEVSFTDGAGNAEGPLASDAVGPVAAPTSGTCPADSDWRATMTMGYSSTDTSQARVQQFGFDPSTDFGDLHPATFTYGSTEVTVTEIYRSLNTSLEGNTTLTDNLSFTVTGGDLPDGTVLNLGATTLTVGTDSHSSTAGQEQWNLKALGLSPTWVGGQEMTVCANLAPVLESAKANGTSLVLTYAEPLDTGSVPLPGAYSVTVDGGAGPAVSSVSVSGTTVTLTLETAVTAANTVTVTYTPGSNPVQDGSGLDALPLTGQEVVIEDTTPPIPASAEVPASGDTLNLTFNEELDNGAGRLPPANSFTVKAHGAVVAVLSVAEGTGLDQFILNLPAAAIGEGQIVTVSYAMPATNAIQDVAGNDALPFTDRPVTNNSTLDLTPPELASAVVLVSGDRLILTFDDDLDIGPGKLPPAGAFTVKTNGVTVDVQSVVVGAGTDDFILNLPAGAITESQTVTVSYSVPTTGTVIADTDGNDAVSFTDRPVVNNSEVQPNTAPVFDEDMVTFEIAENQPVGTDIGDPVTATDEEGDDLEYSLADTPYAGNFSIDAATGQLHSDSLLDFEDATVGRPNMLAILVVADDGRGGTAQITVVVSVTDVDEPPDAPVAVTVTGSGTTSLEVTWTAPSNAGRPDIEHYDVQYREVANQWMDGPQDQTGTNATIMSVDAGKSYEVRVRATNDEGDGPWAVWGTAPPTPAGVTVSKTALTVAEEDPTGNSYTVVLDTQPTASVTVEVGGHSGTDVTPDPATLTFTPSNWDTARTVMVTASDDADTTDDSVPLTHSATSADSNYSGIGIAEVAVTVNDNDTAQVTGVSVTPGNAQLAVSWTRVDHATGYKVQWKSGSQGYNTGNRQDTVSSGSTTNHTIPGLVNGAAYTVQVIATRTGADDGPPSAEMTGTPAVPNTAGVTVSKTALTVTEEDTTGDSYTVVLDTQPTASVTVEVGGHSGTDVTPDPATLTFTPSNWDTARTVMVTASDDADTTDDSVPLTHSATSADSEYNGIGIGEVAVAVNDNDTAQVTGVSVTPGNAQLAVSWTQVDHATGYKVQWKSGSQGYNNTGNRQATVTPGSTTSHTIQDLTNDTAYTVQVIATRIGANDGPPSAEATGTPALAVPGAPALEAAAGNETATLRWTPPNDDGGAPITGYEYTRDGGTTHAAAGGGDARTYTVRGLENGTEYTFEVRAVNRIGAGAWSAAKTVTPVPLTLTVEAVNETVTEGEPVVYRIVMSNRTAGVSVGVVYRYKGEFMRTETVSTVTGIRSRRGVLYWEVERATVDDAVAEANGKFRVRIQPGDGYTLGTSSSVTVTIVDNDGGESPAAPGVTVSKTTLTVAEEDPTGDSYTVVLDTEPSADVTVTVAGYAGTDVTPDPATLTFTPSNWDTARTVMVTASDDADTTDDSVPLTHSATSADSNYSGIGIAEVAVTVNDNDTAQVTGVSVTPGNAQLAVSWTRVDHATGYKVQWKSGSQGYNTGNRQDTVSSGSTTNHTIPGLVNGAAYTVQVIATRTGADDGPPSAEMTGTPAVPNTAGVTVSKTALTVTEEDTTGDSYTVVLDTQPTASVTVEVGGHSGTDVTPDPATLLFTPSNWDTARTVTVTAGDDADTTNDTVTLTHNATSTDSEYSGIAIGEVAVTVNDNDTAQVTGVTVTPGNAQLAVNWTQVDHATGYKVQWKSGSEGYDTGDRQATVTPGSTTSHTIQGLTNGAAYTLQVIATRTGANDGLPSAEMTGTPAVPTTAGVTVSTTALTVAEEDPTGNSYTVVLDTQPTASVTVEVGGHTGTDVTPDPATLTFTPSNWDTARTVMVTAADDADTTDDSVPLTHSATSADSNYSGIGIAEVAVTVNDNDTAQVTGVSVTPGNAQLAVSWTRVDHATGYKVQWKSGSQGYNTGNRQDTVSSGSTTNHTIPGLVNGAAYTVQVIATRTGADDGPPSAEMTGTPAVPNTAGVTVSKTALTVTEEDTTGDSYTVVLDTQPTASVTVEVGGHSGTDVTPDPATLTFTPSNWDTARTVMVTASDDADTTDDSVPLTHSATSADSEYNGIGIGEVAVAVNDNDTAQVTGVSVTPGNAQLAVSWTQVDHATGYKVQWKSGSQGYNNTGNRQATVTPGSTTSHTIQDLTNDTAYTVQVIATRIGANDGPPSAEATGTPALAVPGAPALEAAAGNETATLRWTPPNDDGGAPITGYEYTRDGGTTHAAAGGGDARTYTVRGLENGTEYTFEVRAVNRIGAGAWSAAKTVTPVPLTLTVEAVNETVTEGEPVVYRIVMSNRTAGVSVGVVYRYKGEFMRTETVSTVTGIRSRRGVLYWEVERATVDDAVAEANGKFRVRIQPGDGYTLGTSSSVTVTIVDNDGGESPAAPGVTVSKTTLTVAEEDPTGDSYTVVLDTEPSADVTVTVAGYAGTDVTPDPATLTFTPSNWDTARTVMVTASDDADTTDDSVPLTHSATSADSNYSGIGIAEVAVTVNDNDTAQVTGVSVTPGNAQLAVSWTRVDHATGYKVQWKSGSQGYNTGNRQDTVSSGSTTNHTIPGLVNGAAYTVQVIATRTGADDGPPSAEMTGTPAVPNTAGVTVSKTALTVTEEDTTGDSYTVVLDTQPTASVTVEVGGHSGTDVTPDPATLLFTPSNWDTARTVTVTAGDDADTTNDTVTLTHNATSTDSEYSGIAIGEVAVTVNDNDTAQVTGVTVTPGNAQLAVNWTQVDHATGYKVQWKSGSEGYDTGDRQATVTPGSTTSHTIQGLTNGAAYTLQVIATRTGANDGLPSAEMTGTPAVPTTAGVTVSTTALTVAEEDTTGDRYTVVLDTEPTADVTVTVAGHTGTAVTPDPATLLFTPSNWDTAQSVTVTAAEDTDTTDDTVLLTHRATSADNNYNGIGIAEVTVTVTDNDTAQGPVVTGAHLASGPGPDGVWSAGDTVKAVVQFSEAVTAGTSGGAPTLAIVLGGQRREAVYVRGSGTAALTFHHVVDAADDGALTARVVAGGLSLKGATIRNAAGVDAELGFVLAPAVTSVAVAPDPDGDGRWSPGEAVTVTVGFSDKVTVDTSGGTPSVAVLAGDGEREADYSTGSGTATLRFAYTVTADDGAVTSVQVPANGLALNGGAIVGPTGLAAALAHPEASRMGTPAAPALSVADASAAEGGTLVFAVTLDRAAAAVVAVDWATSDDTAQAGKDYNAASGTLVFAPGETARTVHVAVLEDNEVEGAETMELTLSNATGAGLADATATGTVSGPAGEQPAISVADDKVREGPDVELAFAVTLDRASQETVTVDWETLDGGGKAGAKAGQDYVAASGTLAFAPGETAKTVHVAVLDDAHDEGREVMLLILTNAVGATIADAVAKGTIENSDHIPKAWIARFGRTVAEQVLEAVEGRMRATPAPGVEVALAGERIGGQAEPGAEVALAGWLKGETDPEEAQRLTSRAVTPRDLLTGSSFALTAETDGKDLVSLWGRAAVTRFDGREGDLMLDGEVVTGMLGADWTRGRWTAGLIVSHSAGEGGYSGAPGAGDGAGNGPGAGTGPGSGSGASGRVEATLTGVFPWGRYALSDRLEAWGAAGYGQGELTVTPKRPGTDEDGAAIRAGLELGMAAAGLRGVLLDPESGSGFRLTGKIDAMVVQTASGRGRSADGGNLAPARATVTRLRLGLEGSRPILFDGGFTLTPSLEIGVRHDGGDAETGFGLDLGGGLALSDPKRGLQAELRGRGLLTHESKGFRDLGFSGSLAWEGNPGSDRGAKLRLTQTVGGSSSGGAGALLSRTTLEGLAANDDGAGGNDELKSRRLELKFGYGLSAFGDRFTWTPEVGVDLSDTGRDYSLGWRLVRGAGSGGGSLDLSFEATRRESANDDTPPVHEVGLRLTARF